MRIAGYILLGIVVLALVIGAGIGTKILFFPVHTLNNEINTAYGISDKTLNADNAIYNYEWFKQQDADINAANQKLEIANQAVKTFEVSAGPRKDWQFEDRTEDARLQAVAQGIESQLKDMIATYDARSKMADRAIFKDGLLPNYIDATTFLIKN